MCAGAFLNALRLSSHPVTKKVQPNRIIFTQRDPIPLTVLKDQATSIPVSTEVSAMSNQSKSTIFHSSHDNRASIFVASGSLENSS